MSLGSTTALALLTSHAFITKLYITIAFRAGTTMDKSNAENVKRIMDSQEMKRSVSAQNNEAEWANIFIATLGILYLKGYNTYFRTIGYDSQSIMDIQWCGVMLGIFWPPEIEIHLTN